MRNISFALTTEAVRARTKTVTRRLGWSWLEPGTLLQPVVKCQGLKKGEHVEKIGGPITIVSVTRESLAKMIILPTYGREDVKREGFPHLTRAQFVRMFADHNGCEQDAKVTRIAFEYVDGQA